MVILICIQKLDLEKKEEEKVVKRSLLNIFLKLEDIHFFLPFWVSSLSSVPYYRKIKTTTNIFAK